MTEAIDGAAAPVVVFVEASKRWRAVDLEHPVMVGDKLIRTVTVMRMNTAQVAAWYDSIDPSKMLIKRFPMFYDETGARVPDDVIDALDDDDGVRLVEAAADFLPRRFLANLTGSDSAPATGEPTAPSSDAK